MLSTGSSPSLLIRIFFFLFFFPLLPPEPPHVRPAPLPVFFSGNLCLLGGVVVVVHTALMSSSGRRLPSHADWVGPLRSARLSGLFVMEAVTQISADTEFVTCLVIVL